MIDDIQRVFFDALSEHAKTLEQNQNLSQIELSIKKGQLESQKRLWLKTLERVQAFCRYNTEILPHLQNEIYQFTVTAMLRNLAEQQTLLRREGNTQEAEKLEADIQTNKYVLNRYRRIFREIVQDVRKPLLRGLT